MFYINFRIKMAPFSNAKRKHSYRAKLSEERREEVKQQDRERKREKKENTILTEEQKEKRQIKEREGKRLYWEKQKETKGQAIKKLHKALPTTPTKRVEVIRSLFKSLSPKNEGFSCRT